MGLKERLGRIVDSSNIIDKPEYLEAYAKDQSFVKPVTPDIAVKVRQVQEIQEILRLANRESIPVIPYSSGLNLHGATVPYHGGIILDMTGMNTILEINEKDWFVIIEPGVTYEQLQNTLEPRGFSVMIPFGVPPKRSVLSSYLERDVLLSAASFEYGNYLIFDTELVLPTGELLRTGCWNLGGRPGGFYGPGFNMLYRLWTGAQGTLGVFTKMIVNIQKFSPMKRFFFIPFQKMEDIPEPLKHIQRREIGLECFGLNRFNLAAMLASDWEVPQEFPAQMNVSSEFDKIQKSLPPWTLVIGLASSSYFADEKIQYQEDTLRELCSTMGLTAERTLPGFSSIEAVFIRESLRPWGILKKFNYRGAVHDLSFKAPLKKIPEFENAVTKVAEENGYPLGDIGGYFVVLERGRGVHCEFDFHCDPHDAKEKERAKRLWLSASRTLMDEGALFDRPYGEWAEMVYARAPQYASKLKQIKAEMDPKRILNPGKLCFCPAE